MTSKQLAALGQEYMRRLRLDEWMPKVDIRFANKAQTKGNVGCSYWCAERKTAWIYIARPNVLKADEPSKPLKQIVGETLLHELLHLRLEGHTTPGPEDTYDALYELGLNELATALWSAWGDAATT